jgi:predicted SprT family Zn-dependent metalloprotease
MENYECDRCHKKTDHVTEVETDLGEKHLCDDCELIWVNINRVFWEENAD